MNDTPTLVCPRPVRITSSPTFFLGRAQRLVTAKETHERHSSVEEIKSDLFTETSQERELSSPRASSRPTLPSEALEEFLSILKPGFFPPRSPIRTGRQVMPSLRGRLTTGMITEELEIVRSTESSRNNRTPESVDGIDGVDFQFLDLDDTHFRWFSSNVLSSPVSRSNTRNPFQRHATYPMVKTPVSPFTSLSLSPAAIPLPLPTADELLESQ